MQTLRIVESTNIQGLPCTLHSPASLGLLSLDLLSIKMQSREQTWVGGLQIEPLAKGDQHQGDDMVSAIVPLLDELWLAALSKLLGLFGLVVLLNDCERFPLCR